MKAINTLTASWNRGYQSTPIRALQSLGILMLFAGIFAAGISIGAAINHANALDTYKGLLENHYFQVGALTFGALIAGYLFRRITNPVKESDQPDEESGERTLKALYILAITATLFGCGLGIAAYISHGIYGNYSMNLLNNKIFALSTAIGGGLLGGFLLNYALPRFHKTKIKAEPTFLERSNLDI